MKRTTQYIVAGIVTTVTAGSLIGVGAASAHNGQTSDNIVEKIATKFNLNSEEVSAVFEETKAEKQAEMEAKKAEHLQSLVDAGTITAEQKEALEQKHEEMKSAREAAKAEGLTREEMKEKMEAARTEFKSWAEEQGINLDAIRPERGEGFGRGLRKGMNN